jgi:Fe(3+) dicitrate transport protein
LACSSLLQAQDAAPPFSTPPPVFEELAPVVVIGSKDNVRQQVGAAAFVDATEIRSQNYTNVSRVLQRVPGVYVRDEDGLGNFPNISIRGADGTRSERATVMEDGVLSAPAPYSAPGAYYSPRVARMSGIEILKGSSQVRYGPHTTGGVVNYLSTPVPTTQSLYSRYTFGSNGTNLFLGQYGDVFTNEAGTFGYLLELHGQSSDGFRTIRGYEGNETGYELFEPMLKVFWEPATALEQRFEFKFGYTDFDADESYLGLTETDVRSDPFTRYPSTVFDHIDTEQIRTYLRWQAQPTDTLSLESTIYFNRFSRNWYKLDHSSTAVNPLIDAEGRIVGRTSLNNGILQGNPNLGVLQGIAPGSIAVKANNRHFESYGWQNVATLAFDTGTVGHSLSGGVRFHADYEDRVQSVDVFNAGGNNDFTLYRRGVAGEDADRRQEVFATSFFVEDAMRLGPLTVKPGLRYEKLQMDLNTRGVRQGGDLDTYAAGVGMTYDLSESNTVFGGVFRGISTPGPNAYLNDGVGVEESVGYETGIRHRRDAFAAELAGFVTDYANLVGTDTGLGLGTSNVNAGAASVWGFESMVSYDIMANQGSPFQLPTYLTATWTSAELHNALATGGAENIYAGGTPGASLPYVPAWKLAGGIGLNYEAVSLNLDGTWVDETFGTADNFTSPVTSARQGVIDSALVFDLSASYQLGEHVKLLGGVQNLLDETYISSRLPEGPRNAAPRTYFIGVEMNWEAFGKIGDALSLK